MSIQEETVLWGSNVDEAAESLRQIVIGAGCRELFLTIQKERERNKAKSDRGQIQLNQFLLEVMNCFSQKIVTTEFDKAWAHGQIMTRGYKLAAQSEIYDQNMVFFNGKKVCKDWPDRVNDAQCKLSYEINGSRYLRVRYGDELSENTANEVPCEGCFVRQRQFHVPGCKKEHCPVHEQLATYCHCLD